MSEQQKKIKVTANLTDLAREFGYDLEVDVNEDVSHEGYRVSEIRENEDLEWSEDLAKVQYLFPGVVANALEQAQKEAMASEIRRHRLNAFMEAVTEVNLLGGGADYQDSSGNSVEAKAGVTEVEVNEEENTVTLEIVNPEHLINSIMAGIGIYGAQLEAGGDGASIMEIQQRLPLLKHYFEVYGETKPSAEFSSFPSYDQESMEEDVRVQLQNLSMEEISEAVLDYATRYETTTEDLLALASQLTQQEAQEIRQAVVNKKQAELDFWNK